MQRKLRLLPILIIVATLGFGTKVGGLWSEFRSTAQAQEAVLEDGSEALEVAEAEAETEADADAEPDGDSEDEDFAEGDEAEDEGEDEDQIATAEDYIEEDRAPRPRDNGPQFSRAEVEMLQSLVERREFLDQRGVELDIRENLLKAAERRIEEKIVALKDIEISIQDLLQRHDDQEEKKLRSLVQIYESMKPKQAARIFEELDLVILIDVAERMNERKIAPILAQMDPARARTVTVEIRTRNQLPETGG